VVEGSVDGALRDAPGGHRGPHRSGDLQAGLCSSVFRWPWSPAGWARIASRPESSPELAIEPEPFFSGLARRLRQRR
jgi:hypothetical protein